MTAEQWDGYWFQIRADAIEDGLTPDQASMLADAETAEQFGPRPADGAA
jgi:hypothetical protein